MVVIVYCDFLDTSILIEELVQETLPHAISPETCDDAGRKGESFGGEL